jgi:hypothetical protein
VIYLSSGAGFATLCTWTVSASLALVERFHQNDKADRGEQLHDEIPLLLKTSLRQLYVANASNTLRHIQVVRLARACSKELVLRNGALLNICIESSTDALESALVACLGWPP